MKPLAISTYFALLLSWSVPHIIRCNDRAYRIQEILLKGEVCRGVHLRILSLPQWSGTPFAPGSFATSTMRKRALPCIMRA
jgi:hypothetical protein